MEVFCISNLVNSVMEADEEFVVLDVHFAVTDGGMEAMFEMLHEFLTAPRWVRVCLCVCIRPRVCGGGWVHVCV
jgi:hypothetical protein